MRIITKEQDDKAIISFIFDIFTRFSPEKVMDNRQINEVVAVFKKQSLGSKLFQKNQ